MARPRALLERPDGLVYEPELLDEDEERELVVFVERLPFHEVRMRGQVARRTVIHFGFDYDYEGWGLTPAEPLPQKLASVRDRCAKLAGVEAEALAQTLVSRYPPGAGIGWHRDAPMFGASIVGVSLLSACRMRFQRGAAAERRTFDLELGPRSGYVLSGASRSAWQHSIPPTKELRYSITFRTLRNPDRRR